ncbi:hypothetical protein DI09_43p140 [Mitosporidium daphniae]|uniref:N(6)-L-threonylcarbamoyladenine synthase n=1 Tax=Mitosporidium daphniae TaxID=1485682 RepID=A0A098VQN7_9MICR|nr:uncharacterized protein DI09_43p140 [Mitosporidium daphniae]KGG51139.1 hypothetical protein DI09_43p140 [Mitosporidium daphniae]|eukprot:XP_013237566.1 uncharacterized protein DI09_43p140 [Mitosporidium daphniae]
MCRTHSILAIETSCDDTSVAVINSAKVLFHETIRQDGIHQPYRGIVPSLAAAAHRKNLPLLLKKAFDHLDGAGIDFVAATRGPGIGSSLSVGWSTAVSISLALNRPLISTHHMEGHLLMPFFDNQIPIPPFPFLTLLVSGGHTMWVDVADIGKYAILGTTLDDSIGDAFDKGGRYLGLRWEKGSSYGAALEQAALLVTNLQAYDFPHPLCRVKSADFSFSGLKSALSRVSIKDNKDIPNLAYSYQTAIIRHVLERMRHIPSLHEKYSALIISGGVARNASLVQAISKKAAPLPIIVPASEFCTDNSLMIANAALIRICRKKQQIVNMEEGTAHEYYPIWDLDKI